MASRGGHDNICDMMINYGANNMHSALTEACYSGSIPLINKFINLGAQTFDAGFARACYGGNINVVKMLIDHDGVEIEWGMFEACHGGYLDVLKFLVDKLETNCAITYGELNYMLLNTRASDRNERDRPQYRREIVDYLVSKGANDFKDY